MRRNPIKIVVAGLLALMFLSGAAMGIGGPRVRDVKSRKPLSTSAAPNTPSVPAFSFAKPAKAYKNKNDKVSDTPPKNKEDSEQNGKTFHGEYDSNKKESVCFDCTSFVADGREVRGDFEYFRITLLSGRVLTLAFKMPYCHAFKMRSGYSMEGGRIVLDNALGAAMGFDISLSTSGLTVSAQGAKPFIATFVKTKCKKHDYSKDAKEAHYDDRS